MIWIKAAIIAEVKRNARKIDMSKLETKVKSIQKELAKYKTDIIGLFMDNM